MNAKLKNILVRASSGAVFVALLLWCAYQGGGFNYLLYFVFGGMAAFEFHKIIEKKVGKASVLWIFITLVFILLRFNDVEKVYDIESNNFLPLILLVVALSELLFTPKSGVEKMSLKIFGLLYIGYGFSALPLIGEHHGNYHFSILFIFFFTLWANDTFAYLSGMWKGKTPLFPRVSPNKTWEGTVGGAIMALLFTYALTNWVFKTPYDNSTWMALSIIIVVFGALGDLLESLIKRWANVKDSGNIMPGHGGILDRLDSAIFAGPAIIFYLMYFAN